MINLDYFKKTGLDILNSASDILENSSIDCISGLYMDNWNYALKGTQNAYFSKYGIDSFYGLGYWSLDKIYISKVLDSYYEKNGVKDMNILLLGCGNLHEVLVLLEELKNKDYVYKNINIVIIDILLWKYKSFYKEVLKVSKNFKCLNVFFIEKDFYKEMAFNYEYKNFDIVYFSRCINPLDHKLINISTKKFVDKFCALVSSIDVSKTIAFSQVLNYSEGYDESKKEFELDLLKKLSRWITPNIIIYEGEHLKEISNDFGIFESLKKTLRIVDDKEITCYKRGINSFLYLCN